MYCYLLLSFLCLVVHLEGSTPTKYGLLLNNDDRYKDVKRELSKYCGLVCSQLLLVEIFGASVKVQCSFSLATLIYIWFCLHHFENCQFSVLQKEAVITA